MINKNGFSLLKNKNQIKQRDNQIISSLLNQDGNKQSNINNQKQLMNIKSHSVDNLNNQYQNNNYKSLLSQSKILKLMNNPSLHIKQKIKYFPSQIIFSSTNQQEKKQFQIQNVSSNPIKIKFIKPQTKFFYLTSEKANGNLTSEENKSKKQHKINIYDINQDNLIIPPGLNKKIYVQFRKNGIRKDMIKQNQKTINQKSSLGNSPSVADLKTGRMNSNQNQKNVNFNRNVVNHNGKIPNMFNSNNLVSSRSISNSPKNYTNNLSNERFFDNFKIILQDNTKYQIALKCIKQLPQINYDKLIDLGYVDMNKIMKITKKIKNTTSQYVKIKIFKQFNNFNNHKLNNNIHDVNQYNSNNNNNITVTPTQIFLKPNSSENIQFNITPMNVGTYHHKILLQLNYHNISNILQPIQIIYNTYQYSYFIMKCKEDINNYKLDGEGKQIKDTQIYGGTTQGGINSNNINTKNIQKITQVNFGHMIYGQKKTFTYYAVNNTPNYVQMKGKIRSGFKSVLPFQSTFQSPQQFGQECCQTFTQLNVKNIKLAPFSRQKFTLMTYGKISQIHMVKVAKYAKSSSKGLVKIKGNKTTLTNNKIINEMNEKYKIQENQYNQTFIAEFLILQEQSKQNNNNSTKQKKHLSSHLNKSKQQNKQIFNKLQNKQSNPIKISSHQKQTNNKSFISPVKNILMTELKGIFHLPLIKILPTQFVFYQKLPISKVSAFKFSIQSFSQLPLTIKFSKIIGVQILPKEYTFIHKINNKNVQNNSGKNTPKQKSKTQLPSSTNNLNQIKQFDMFITPVNLGIIDQTLKVKINDAFEIEFRLRYQADQNTLKVTNTAMLYRNKSTSNFVENKEKNLMNSTLKAQFLQTISSNNDSNPLNFNQTLQKLEKQTNNEQYHKSNYRQSLSYHQTGQQGNKFNIRKNLMSTSYGKQRFKQNLSHSISMGNMNKNINNNMNSNLNITISGIKNMAIGSRGNMSNIMGKNNMNIPNVSNQGQNIDQINNGQLSVSNNTNNNQNNQLSNIIQSINKTNRQKTNQKASSSPINRRKGFDYIEQTQPHLKQLQYRSANKMIKQNKINLPSPKESLFVTKKIDKYQPYLNHQSTLTRKMFKAGNNPHHNSFNLAGNGNISPNNNIQMNNLLNNATNISNNVKQYFSPQIRRQARNRRQAQQIARELTGQSLRNIKINSKIISFGKMFIGSKMIKEFIVENQSEYSIQVKLKGGTNNQSLANNNQNSGAISNIHHNGNHNHKKEQQMLQGTDFQQQIISPHSCGRYKISLQALQCGKFQHPITYVINKIHQFQFLIQAEIQLAQLSINKSVLKMSYLDDLSEMYLKESFILKNQGNAMTQFFITQQYNNFQFEPNQGQVDPGSSIQILVIYKYAQKNNINAGQIVNYRVNNSLLINDKRTSSFNSVISNNENNPLQSLSGFNQYSNFIASNSKNNISSTSNFQEQRICIEIKNGISMSIKVTFNSSITEPKCIVKESKLNFGVTIVSKSKSKSFILRNLSRNVALFQIQNNEPDCKDTLYFDITKGKLQPQSSKQIMVNYKSNIIKSIQSYFKINIRGGLTINVPICAQSVAPNIKLKQQSYNFGNVSCGSAKVRVCNVINQSQTMIQLLLDLLDKRTNGMEYLFVTFSNVLGVSASVPIGGRNSNNIIGVKSNHLNNGGLGIIVQDVNNNQKAITSHAVGKKTHQNLGSNSSQNLSINSTLNNINNPGSYLTPDQQQLIIDNAITQHQIHKLKIPPKSIFTFYLIFKPKLPGFYQFQLPLYLQNFIKNNSLNNMVTCFATEPRFIIQPNLIKFKKKIINQKQSTISNNMEFLTLKNLGNKQLKWKIEIQNMSGENVNGQQGNNTSSKNLMLNASSTFSKKSNPFPLNHSSETNHFTCFQLEKSKGSLKPNSIQCINIIFNPFQAGYYCYKLPLLIFNQQKSQFIQQTQIRLEGLGQYPSLLFDRKQVIMPVVPIGIQSLGMVKIVNQGYETINLRHKVQICDFDGNLIQQKYNGSVFSMTNNNNSSNNNNLSTLIPQLKIIYPQGNKINMNKKQIYVIIQFIARKSISFTCLLSFYDDTKDSRIYSIPVSGTVDNSLLTIWPYLSDKQNKFKFIPGQLGIGQGVGQQTNNQLNAPNMLSKSLQGNSSILNNFNSQQNNINTQNNIITIQSIDSRNLVDKVHCPYQKMKQSSFKLDVQIIRRWINNYFKDQKINKFPEDLITNPQNLLKLLHKMTQKKQFDILIQSVANIGQMECLGQTQNNYQQQKNRQNRQSLGNNINANNLNNANNTPVNSNINSLNLSLSPNIRNTTNSNSSNPNSINQTIPSSFTNRLQFFTYLLKLLKSMGCLLSHIRPYFLLQKKQFFIFMQQDSNWKNMSQYYNKIFHFVHIQSWIILFYQIVNSFWYNVNKLKSTLTQGDKQGTFIYGNNSLSNVYSFNQLQILKWIRNIYQKYSEFQDIAYKFLSYGDDFKDCIGLIYAIYHHIVIPSKKKKALQGLNRKPSTLNEISSNIKILYSLIQKIGVNPLIYEQEYHHIKQKQIFLLTYQLYQLLPQQLPKTNQPIQFVCLLGQNCTKYIQIKNLSNKIINYWVRIEGSKDFSHEEQQSIKIQPKSVYKFLVNFTSRISSEEVAYLTFLNKLENDTMNISGSGSTLVFQLRSNIIGRKSIKKLQNVYCPLYQNFTLKIPIQNPFQDYQYANFQVQLFEQFPDQELKQFKQNKQLKIKLYQLRKCHKLQSRNINQQSFIQQNNNGLGDSQNPSNQISQTYEVDNQNKMLNISLLNNQTITNRKQELSPFTCFNFFTQTQTMKIKKNSSSILELTFNPLQYKKVRCYIILHDPMVGQFQYQILGICQIPKVLQQIRYPQIIYTHNKQNLQINTPGYNNFMIKSNLIIEQKLYAKYGKPVKYNQKAQDKQTEYEKYKIQINMDSKILQYVTFPNEHVIKNIKKQTNPGDLMNKFKFQCYFQVVIKDLALDFLLVSQDRKDVRRIKVHLNLVNRPIISQLTMKTTARAIISQPIPLQNTTLKDWRVKATLSTTQDNFQQNQIHGYLSLKQGQKLLTKDIIIKKFGHNQTSGNTIRQNIQTANSLTQGITLYFISSWICKLQGKLIVHNVTTNQQLIYMIRAICQQPTSEGHLFYKVSTCTEEVKKLMIKNPYPQVKSYKIQTDLDQLQVPEKFIFENSISSNNMGCVNLLICKNITAHKSIGFIKFIDDYGRFFWYTLTIQFYTLDKEQKNYQFSCQIGQSCLRTIQVQNTTNQKQRFYVIYPQNNYLKGIKQFQIQSGEIYNLQVKFIPTQIVTKQMSQIKLSSKPIHQKNIIVTNSINKTYKVIYTSKQSSIKKNIQKMITQIGKPKYYYLTVSNPYKYPIKINCEIVNRKYFNVIYNQNVPAKCMDHEVKVQFLPMEEGKYTATLKIKGQQFNLQVFEIQGEALFPHSIQKIRIKGYLTQPTLQVIKFRNPNPKKMKQKIQIIIQDKYYNHNCFKIINSENQQKMKSWSTNIIDILGIPVEFLPLQKGFYQSMMTIKCSYYQWKYLLEGCINFKMNNTNSHNEKMGSLNIAQEQIQGECKKQTIKVMKMQIPNFLKKNSKNEINNQISQVKNSSQENVDISLFDQVQFQHDQDKKQAQKLNAWSSIKILSPLENQKRTQQQENEITLYIKFTPMQPIEQIVSLIVSSSKNQYLKLIYRIRLSIKPSKPQQTITLDIDSLKKYKFQLNLDQLIINSGTSKPHNNKKIEIKNCELLKNEFVQARICQNQVINSKKNLMLMSKTDSKMKEGIKQGINETGANNIIQLIFNPTNLTFSSRSKNTYSQILMVYSQRSFWAYEILFRLCNTQPTNGNKNKNKKIQEKN